MKSSLELMRFLLKRPAAIFALMTLALLSFMALSARLWESYLGFDHQRQNPFGRFAKPGARLDKTIDEKQQWWTALKTEKPQLAKMLSAQLGVFHESDTEDEVLKWLEQESSSRWGTVYTWPVEVRQSLSEELRKLETFHILGTDELGRDVFLRLAFGARLSLGIALSVAIAASLLGLMLGVIAGFFGGWVDQLIMRGVDALLSLPLMPVLIVVSSLPMHQWSVVGPFFQGPEGSVLRIFIILVMFSWMGLARLIRGQTLVISRLEFVQASRVLGASSLWIMTRHLISNVLPYVWVSTTLGVAESIQFEAALSFLGLGIQQPLASWGNMLANAQEWLWEAPHLAILPGVAIFLLSLAFNFLGDSLQQFYNPRLRSRF